MNKDTNLPVVFNEYTATLYGQNIIDDSWNKIISINRNDSKMTSSISSISSSKNSCTKNVRQYTAFSNGGTRGSFGIFA